MQHPPRIIICGAPASGKGTQCEFIKEHFKVVHLSTGDILRAAVDAGNDLGIEAKKYMDKGELVPDSLMINLILARLKENDCETNGWLLDGFPRTGAQADALLAAGVHCDILIQMQVDDSLLVERVVGRRSDPVTGKIYHMKFSPPESDDVRARLVHRSDDTEENILVRLNAYHRNLAAILDKYTDRTHQVVVKANTFTPSMFWNGIKSQIIRSRKYLVVFVLGGPGSGKGTVCKSIERDFGYKHLSAGDLLREEIQRGGEQAESIHKATVAGAIVPAQVTINLLLNAMRASGQRKFLIHGFPRNQDNFNKWIEMTSETCIIEFALFLQCNEATMKERLLQRSKLSERDDDNEETIIHRFRTFYNDSMPVLDTCCRAGLVRTINAGVPPRVVAEQAAKLFLGAVLSPPATRTFGMIKPDAVAAGHVPAIHEMITAAGLTVVFSKLVYMNADIVTQFYAEHSVKSFFPSLRQFMSSGPSLIMVLEGDDAINAWRLLLGPTNSNEAATKKPNSIRGKFGTDGTRNACHGADSFVAAIREIEFWTSGPGSMFESVTAGNSITAVTDVKPKLVSTTAPGITASADDKKTAKDAKKVANAADALATNASLSLVVRLHPHGLPTEETFAMIKPGTSDNHYLEVMSVLLANGFFVLAETRTRLTPLHAENFYAEHRGKHFYNDLVEYMTSGPVVLLHLRRDGAVAALRRLIGPTNSINASAHAPFSVRGKFGIDGTRNAIHASDSVASAIREIGFFFQYGHNSTSGGRGKFEQSTKPLGGVTDPNDPRNLVPRHARKVHQLPTISRRDIAVMSKYAYEQVDPLMNILMKKLLLERPTNVSDYCLNELTNNNNLIRLQPLNKSASAPDTLGPYGDDGESIDATGALGDDDLSIVSQT
jgi:adenylate kinase